MADLSWSDAQWQKVKDAVMDAFNKASVASAFLPMYGPLAGSTETVRNERLLREDPAPGEGGTSTVRLEADHDAVNLRLVNLTVNVELTSEQVADETLSNALLAFRRAANILALEQDQVVFKGHGRGFLQDNSTIVVNRVEPQRGLADLSARHNFTGLEEPANLTRGQAVVAGVVAAIQRLEDRSNPSPFACVLGNELYNRAHDPSPSLVLPADRITPLLRGGALLRSGRIDPNTGIVVSLAANAADIVVGTPPTVQFLQRQTDARFLFRVYERFALRLREAPPPVEGFRIRPTVEESNIEKRRIDELEQF